MENRTQLLDSFLQVTINSNKLMQTLDKMSRQINQHATQIKILRQVIPTIKQSVYTSLQTSQARMKLDVQRNTLKIKEQLKLMKLHLDSLDSEISKVNINCEKKMKEKDQQVSFLDEQKKRIQSIINLYEQNRMNAQTKINQQIWSIKQTLERVLREFAQYDNKTDDKFQVMFLKIQSMIKKINVNQRTCEDSQPTSRKERSSVAPKIYPKTTKISNISNWASFSAKISQFQKKNTQKQQNPSYLNKVLYSKKIESQQDISSAEHNDSGFSLDQSIIDKSNIQGIKSLLKQYNLQIQKNLENLKNKIIVQDQKLGINVRKIDKLTQNQNQYKINLMKFSQKRPQQQSLQVLRNQIKKTHLQIMQEVQKKVNQSNFQREKNKIMQKISILHENLIQKAEKGDMKKAFMFMQQKIKQIIILIASDQNQQKNGAIKKIPVKCLSCDKGLQLESVTTPHRLASPLTSRQNEPNIKTATRKIRSRIQISNQISCQTSLTNL